MPLIKIKKKSPSTGSQATIWHEIFSHYSYATLTKSQRNSVDSFIEQCFAFKTDSPMTPWRFPGKRGSEQSRAAVGAIFDKRIFRKEALTNYAALIARTTYVKTQVLNQGQSLALEQELRFALYQYLAQFQAAKDHIGVIRSQETELIRNFVKIEKCARLLQHVALRKAHLEIEELKHQVGEGLVEKIGSAMDRYQTCLEALKQPIPFVEKICPNQYDIQVSSPDKMQKGKIYLSVSNGKISYSVITPFGFQIQAHPTNIDAPQIPLETVDEKTKALILAYAENQEHILGRYAVKTLLPRFAADLLEKGKDQLDSDYVIKKASEGNALRLCWVWTRSLVEAIVLSGHQILLASTIVAAYVSFILYWIRGTIVLSGGLFHAFDHEWLSEEERVIPPQLRRMAHMNDRRDDILNDEVWGTGNFACFYLLTGTLLLGFLGDLITGLLLCMDLTLACLRYHDGRIDHQNKMASYDEDLNKLFDKILQKFNHLKQKIQPGQAGTKEIVVLQVDSTDDAVIVLQKKKKAMESIDLYLRQIKDAQYRQHIEKLDVLIRQYNLLLANQDKLQKRWSYDYIALFADVCYAVALFVSFGVMVGFYVHLLQLGLPMAVVIAGATGLCVSNIIWRTAKAYLERDGINHTAENAYNSSGEYNRLMVEFKDLNQRYQALNANHPDQTEERLRKEFDMKSLDYQMKQLYLDMLQLGADSGEQQEMVHYKKMLLIRDNLLRVLVPLAVILLLIFAPPIIFSVPTYVFLLIGLIAGAMLSIYLIDQYFKPKSSTAWHCANGDGCETLPYFTPAEELEFQQFKKLAIPAVNTKDCCDAAPDDNTLLLQIQNRRSGKHLTLFRELTNYPIVTDYDAQPAVSPLFPAS